MSKFKHFFFYTKNIQTSLKYRHAFIHREKETQGLTTALLSQLWQNWEVTYICLRANVTVCMRLCSKFNYIFPFRGHVWTTVVEMNLARAVCMTNSYIGCYIGAMCKHQ